MVVQRDARTGRPGYQPIIASAAVASRPQLRVLRFDPRPERGAATDQRRSALRRRRLERRVRHGLEMAGWIAGSGVLSMFVLGGLLGLH